MPLDDYKLLSRVRQMNIPLFQWHHGHYHNTHGDRGGGTAFHMLDIG